MEAALGECTGLPVKLENDANCAALGEFWSGRIPAADDFVTIYMASGIGSGFIVHGDVYRGASSNAGEIGHLSLDIDGPQCDCGSRGCFEVMATPAVVVADARADPALWQRIMADGEPDSTRSAFSALASAAVGGDPDAFAWCTSRPATSPRRCWDSPTSSTLTASCLPGPASRSPAGIYLDDRSGTPSTGWPSCAQSTR